MARAPGRASRVVATASALLVTCIGAAARAAEDRPYAIPASIDVTRLLAPPPADDAAKVRDLAAVRAAQQTRTAEQAADAEESSAVDVFLFRSVLGPAFTAQRLPRTAALFRRVVRTALPWLQTTKDCWSRPRPFIVDPTLAPLERALASTRVSAGSATSAVRAPLPADSPCAAPPADPSLSPSYPSGHAAVGAMDAIVLAQMVPEQRTALFARGWAYGDARVIGGVHFPSDVEAGRILGTMLIGVLEQDVRFRADRDAARKELRSVLGYP
jgi:acid phosphatase (class A)